MILYAFMMEGKVPIIAIGNDRCAIDYKKQLIKYLIKNGYQVIDCGSNLDKP